MTLPVDTTPLTRAVTHALTSATGKPRSLALNPGLGKHPLFRELAPASAKAKLGDVLAQPGCWVTVTALSDGDGPVQGGDRLHLSVTVNVTITHPSGNPESLTESQKARLVVDRDRVRVLRALTEPGALESDPDGNETGLPSGWLSPEGYSSTGPVWPDGPVRVVTVTHVFRTTVELSTS